MTNTTDITTTALYVSVAGQMEGFLRNGYTREEAIEGFRSRLYKMGAHSPRVASKMRACLDAWVEVAA